MGQATRIPASIPIPNSGRLGSLLRVPIDYLLEVYEGGRLAVAVTLPQGPSEFEQKRPSATMITHTLDGVVREHTENHLTEISLRGSSGYTARLGHTRDGGASFLSGRVILEEFDAFLNDYQTRASQKGHRAVYMVFRALQEKQAFRVEPKNWEWTLDASSSRFAYRWSLELEAYGAPPPSPLVDILSPVTSMARIAQDYLNAGAGAIALAGTALDNIKSEAMTIVDDTARSLGRIGTALSEAISSADGVRTYVTEGLPALYETEAGRFERAWADAVELGVDLGLTSYSERGEALSRDVGYTATLSAYRALTVAGLLGVSPSTLNATRQSPQLRAYTDEGVVASSQRTQLSYTWRAGDSVQSIALRAYGDASRWTEIAEANGLRSPRHWGDGAPIVAGDTLSIPLDDTSEARRRGEAVLYDRDLTLDLSTGDLVLRSNDLATIEGARNLEQGLALRLLTAQGDVWTLPEYGLPVRVGGSAVQREIAYLSAHVSEQLKRDARVRDVVDVEVIIEGDKIAIGAKVSPITGDAVSVVTPYLREV